jgi:hypothetical protein
MLNFINNRFKFSDNKERFDSSSSKYLDITHIWSGEIYTD